MDENIKRFRFIRNLMIFIGILLFFAAFRLQIVESAKYNRLAEQNRIRQKFLQAPRGKIFDRNGIEIANTRPGFYVSIIQAIADQNTISTIMKILEMKKETIVDKCRLQKNKYIPVKIAHDISFEQLSYIEEHQDILNGIVVGVEPLRNYPYSSILCHVLGYVGEITETELKGNPAYTIDDYIGKLGLEQNYESRLKGIDGVEYVEVDAHGREISLIAEKRPTPLQPGQDLHTTIDAFLCESIAVYLAEYKAAACVCLNPKTGAVLSLYSKPGFDPNLFVHGLKREEWRVLINDPDAPMFSRAIMSIYPCGSAFKPFVALAALNQQLIDRHKHFSPCTGKIRLGRRTFKCWKTHGRLDLVKAIIHSCDVYFYQLGSLTGLENISSMAIKFGFGSITQIDLPGEKSGLVPTTKWMDKQYGKNWTEGHVYNVSIGQGDLLMTPLQLACAYAGLANNGRVPTPYIIKPAKPKYRETKIDTAALSIVLEGLMGVVSTGTGQLARIKDFNVYGKTGTVQNPHGDDHSVFVGFAPGEDPELLVCVFIENAGHGGSEAAPIAGRIFNTYFKQKKITEYAEKN